MDLPLKVFAIFIFLTMLIFVQGNIYIRSNTKEEIFNNSRQANYDAVDSTLEKINNYELVTQHELLENWLMTFIENNDLSVEDVVLKFGILSTDPQVIVVAVTGTDKFIILNGDVSSYINSIYNTE